MNVRRVLHLAVTPVVVVGIYAWLIRNAVRDAKTMIARRWSER